MSRLSEIAIRLEGTIPLAAVPERRGGLVGGVAAILTELAARLESLSVNGTTALIDLRSLPMSATDRGELLGVELSPSRQRRDVPMNVL